MFSAAHWLDVGLFVKKRVSSGHLVNQKYVKKLTSPSSKGPIFFIRVWFSGAIRAIDLI